MTDHRQAFGKSSEAAACAELERRGYTILARRYRRRGGEIDIIAKDGDTIVFVEVKARRSRAFGDASESITAHKRRRISAIAVDFLCRARLLAHPCRFDVVSLDVDGGAHRIVVIQNAFEAPSSAGF